jgi:hypothetical protein
MKSWLPVVLLCDAGVDLLVYESNLTRAFRFTLFRAEHDGPFPSSCSVIVCLPRSALPRCVDCFLPTRTALVTLLIMEYVRLRVSHF